MTRLTIIPASVAIRTVHLTKKTHQVAMLSILTLLLTSLCGCGQAIKVGANITKAAAKNGSKAAMKSGEKAASAGGAGKVAAASADDFAKTGFKHIDDAAPHAMSVSDDAARIAINASARTAAYQAARTELHRVASAAALCGEQLASIPAHLLGSVPRVTFQILLQKHKKNQDRLIELADELKEPSLTDHDAVLIEKELESIGRDNERLQAKVADLYRDLG